MRYLYGDSSAFPLNQNFIVTLAAATDCAVALLKVDEALANSHEVAERANTAATREVGDIDELLSRIDSALGQRDHLSNATAKVVEQVAASVKAQFDKAKDGIRGWRDGTIRKSQVGCGPADMMAPIHRFMVRHELPYTSWGLRWKAGNSDEPVQAQVYAIMQRGLTATLSVAIPPKHRWAQPVRVRELEEGATIKLVGKNWLGKEKLRDEPLDKMYVTRITRTGERHQFVLNKKPKEPSEGLKVVMREGDVKRITITRVDEDEKPISDPATVDGSDAQLIKRLWRAMEESIADLVRHRHQLLAATMHGNRVTELDTPAPVATAIIQSIAPLVRDMKRHSRTPGELQLKRDLGDGRREELFISEKEVFTKYAALSPNNQALFDCMGLTKSQLPIGERPSQPQRAEIMATQGTRDEMMMSREVIHASQESLPQARLATPSELLPPPLSEASRPRVNAFPSAHPATQPKSSYPPPAPASVPVPIPSRPPSHRSRPPARSDVAPAQGASRAAPSFPPPPALPSSLPAPSQPPKRGRSASNKSGAPSTPAPASSPPTSKSPSSGEVFRLPPPTVPPPKRRPKRKPNAHAASG